MDSAIKVRLPLIIGLIVASLDGYAQSTISVTASNATGELVRPTNFFVGSLFNGSNIVMVPTNSGLGWGARIHSMASGSGGGTNLLVQTNGVNIGSAGTMNWTRGVTGDVAGAVVTLGVSLDLDAILNAATNYSDAGFQANSNRITTATNSLQTNIVAWTNTLATNFAAADVVILEAATNYADGGFQANSNRITAATNDAYSYTRSVSNELYGVSSNISVAIGNGVLQAATNHSEAGFQQNSNRITSATNTVYAAAVAADTAAFQAATNYTDTEIAEAGLFGLTYMFTSTNSGISNHFIMHRLDVPVSSDPHTNSVIPTNNVYAFSYRSALPMGVSTLRPGFYTIHFHAWLTGPGATCTLTPEIYVQSDVYSEIVTGGNIILSSTSGEEHSHVISLSTNVTGQSTNHIVVAFKASNVAGPSTVAYMYVEGVSASGLTVPVPSSAFVLASDYLSGTNTVTTNLTALVQSATNSLQTNIVAWTNTVTTNLVGMLTIATNDAYTYTRSVSNSLYTVSSNVAQALVNSGSNALYTTSSNVAEALVNASSNSLYAVSSNISQAIANNSSNALYTVSSNVSQALVNNGSNSLYTTSSNVAQALANSSSNALYTTASNVAQALANSASNALYTVSSNISQALVNNGSNSLYTTSSNVAQALSNGAMEAATNYSDSKLVTASNYIRSVTITSNAFTPQVILGSNAVTVVSNTSGTYVISAPTASGTNQIVQTNGVTVGQVGTVNWTSGVTGSVSGATATLGVSVSASGASAGGTNFALNTVTNYGLWTWTTNGAAEGNIAAGGFIATNFVDFSAGARQVLAITNNLIFLGTTNRVGAVRDAELKIIPVHFFTATNRLIILPSGWTRFSGALTNTLLSNKVAYLRLRCWTESGDETGVEASWEPGL